jgi:hypothetical protein
MLENKYDFLKETIIILKSRLMIDISQQILTILYKDINIIIDFIVKFFFQQILTFGILQNYKLLYFVDIFNMRIFNSITHNIRTHIT